MIALESSVGKFFIRQERRFLSEWFVGDVIWHNILDKKNNFIDFLSQIIDVDRFFLKLQEISVRFEH